MLNKHPKGTKTDNLKMTLNSMNSETVATSTVYWPRIL